MLRRGRSARAPATGDRDGERRADGCGNYDPSQALAPPGVIISLCLHQLSVTGPKADVGGARYNLVRRMRRTYSLAALLAIAALSSMPASAQAAKKAAWQDCKANGGSSLKGHYTIAELHTALQTMPAYVEEYSNCYGVIQAQLLKQQLSVKPHSRSHTQPKAHTSSDKNSGGGSTVLIAAIAVVAIGGLGLAFWASRRRRGSPPADGPPAA